MDMGVIWGSSGGHLGVIWAHGGSHGVPPHGVTPQGRGHAGRTLEHVDGLALLCDQLLQRLRRDDTKGVTWGRRSQHGVMRGRIGVMWCHVGVTCGVGTPLVSHRVTWAFTWGHMRGQTGAHA
eukprot:6568145-Prymnesium_polylepis.1